MAKRVDIPCGISAALFFLGSFLHAILFWKNRRGFDHNFQSFLDLDPLYLRELWEFRRGHQGLALTAGILNALAWLCFAVPVLQLSWILSRGGKRQLWVHAMIAVLALGGSFTELIARLLFIGANSAAHWIGSGDFNLDDWLGEASNEGMGWRVLEVTHIITSSLLLWVDAFEWIALLGIFVLIFFSVRSVPEPVFNKQWVNFGLVIGGLCLLGFCADVLRLQYWRTFQKVAMFVSVFNSVFLLPAWVLILGFQLPKATPAYSEDNDAFVAPATSTPSVMA